MSGWDLVRSRARVSDTVVSAVAVVLASLCLIPLFHNLSWLLPAVTVVTAIAAMGAIARGLAMPLPFVPLVEALTLLLVVTTMFAADLAWARIVPTAQAWDALRLHLQTGLVDAQHYSAPVPTSTGLVLLAAGGVGLVALCTDTLFVSVRAPLLAGLALMSLYLAPAFMLSGGAPWWAFPLPALGWLLIMAADQRDRVRRWAGLPDVTRVRGLSTVARRTGVVAVVLATAVSILLPVRAGATWRSGDGAGVGTSASDAPIILDPLVSMRRSLILATDSEVLSYRTNSDAPSYLRVSVLEDFDGQTWRPREALGSGRNSGVALPGNVLSALVAENGVNRVTGGASFTYDIRVRNLQNTYLPLPYPISEVDDISGLGNDWRLDAATGMAFSQDVPATGLAYQVAALDPQIQVDQLRDSTAATGDLWPQLKVPGGMSPAIKETAIEVTSQATTAYDKALALQRWFTREGGFTYSTSVKSGADVDYIAEFLDERVGYCEQFAGAMAIMARTLGIPSRVAVGFTQGAKDNTGMWHVTVRDAHAWPELWFDGVGWARFEPTPRSGGTVLTPAYARSTDATGSQIPELRPFRDLEGFTPSTGATSGSDRTVVPYVLVVLALVALAAACWPMARRRIRRRGRLHRRDYADVVEGAWSEIADLAVDFGQPWSASSTPRQSAERLGRGMSAAATEALRRLRVQVEQVRYAPPPDGRGAGAGIDAASERAGAVRADVAVIARELRGRVRWQVRVGAYCWPSSERRRQRSSMRSMNPGDFAGPAAGGLAGAAASSAGRAPKAE